MTEKDNPNARIDVSITPRTEEALWFLAARERVTVTEALRRLVGYGELVYRTIVVDASEVLIRAGRKTTVIKLTGVEPAGNNAS